VKSGLPSITESPHDRDDLYNRSDRPRQDLLMQSPKTPIARVRLLVPAVVIAGAIGLGLAPGADAQPIDTSGHTAGEWDIQAYDDCMAKIPTIMDPDAYNRSHFACCVNSGGVYNHDTNDCGSPAARPAGPIRKPIGSIPIDISGSVVGVG
jgi:hypothetical protein